jgi:peptide subunit release factor 1 (eRF1)
MSERVLTKKKLFSFLSDLEATPGEYINLYIRTESLPAYLKELSREPEYSPCVREIEDSIESKNIIQKAEEIETGIAIFWQANGEKHIILPPFPVAENKVSIGEFDPFLLYKIFGKKRRIGVILVRWGAYSTGVFESEELLISKTGTGYIQKQHKKGGRSQKRFARRTEEQKKNFLRVVGNRVAERFQSYEPDHIFWGGNKLILRPLLEECSWLEHRTNRIHKKILNVRYANKESLDNVLEEIYKSTVFTF